MTQQIINVGEVANDGTGESLRTAFEAVNNNFSQVWAAGPVNTNVVIANNVISTVPTNTPLILAPGGIGNVQSNAHVVPGVSGVYDLGAPDKRWDSAFVDYYYGNGFFLTGIQVANVGSLVNGNSNVVINGVDGVVTISVDSVANVATFTPDGVSILGNIIASSNVTANYFIGDGSLLTGIVASGGSSIDNGNSNVRIGAPAANVAVSVSGVGNVAVFTPTGLEIANTISATTVVSGNIVASSYQGNGAGLSNITGANVTGNVPSATYAIAAAQAGLAGLANKVIDNAQPNITSVGILNSLSVSGNIFGNYLYGNGRFLTGINANGGGGGGTVTFANVAPPQPNVGDIWIQANTATQFIWFSDTNSSQWAEMEAYQTFGTTVNGSDYGDSNVVSLMSSFGSNTVSTTGNITAGYFIGNGSQLTGLPASYSNADAVSYGEAGWAGNIIPAANSVYSLGNVNNQWLDLWVSNSTIYIGNVPLSIGAGNVLTVNGEALLSNDSNTSITTTGNITAAEFFGNIAVGNVVGIGNIATINLNGNSATVLAGDGTWVPQISSDTLPIANGTTNFDIATANGDATITVGGDRTFTFGQGYLDVPKFGVYEEYGRIRGNGLQLRGDTNGGGSYASIIIPNNADSGGNALTVASEQGAVMLWSNAKSWIFNVDGNLSLPGNGIIGNPANSSLDPLNPNVSTLTFRPDVNYAQELVIDPTAVGHVHLRTNAYGNIDEPAANLFLGGEQSSFEVGASYGGAPNVYVHSGGQNWTFDTAGTLYLPTGGKLGPYGMGWTGLTTDGSTQGALSLALLSSNASYQGQTLASIDLFSGSGDDTQGYVSVNTGNAITGSYQWTFGETGVLSAPGEISAVGNVTTSGNVSGNYILGNGSQLTGLPATYTDSNVASFLNAFGSNTISSTGNITTTGNVSGNYVLGNAAFMTGIPASYGNANVVANLAALGTNPVSTTGNVTAGNLITGGLVSAAGNVTGANVFATNITLSGTGTSVNAGQGNILTNQVTGTQFNFLNGLYTVNLNAGQATANYALRLPANAGSNGQLLTTDGTGNLSWTTPASSYGDSNVVSLLSAFGSNTVSTTGNITAGNVNITNLANAANLNLNSGYVNTAASAALNLVPGGSGGTRVWSKLVPNANVAFSLGSTTEYWANGYIGNTISTTVSATGNVTGGNILTAGIVSATGNLTAGNIATGIISASGNVTAQNFVGNISITGNVTGTSSNVTLVAGSYNTTFDNTGNVTLANSNVFVGVTNSILPNTVASFSSNVNSYTQITNQNKNTGADATADYILTADNGSDTTNYGDFGIINSGYDNNTPTNSLGNIVFAGDTYVYAQGNVSNTSQSGGNLVLGAAVAAKTVKIFAGGNTNSALVANISNVGVSVTGVITVSGNLTAGGIGSATVNQLLSSIQQSPSANNFISNAHTVINGAGGNYLGLGQYPIGATLNGSSVQYGQWIQSGYSNAASPAYYPIILNPAGGNVVAGGNIVAQGGGVVNKATGFVNAGTFVTLDNIKATVTTSGNRSLALATVSGSFSAYVSGIYTLFSGGVAGTGATATVNTTTGNTPIIAWNFTGQGDTVTYIINDTTNSRGYRITMMIGGSYNNNFIAIERL